MDEWCPLGPKDHQNFEDGHQVIYNSLVMFLFEKMCIMGDRSIMQMLSSLF